MFASYATNPTMPTPRVSAAPPVLALVALAALAAVVSLTPSSALAQSGQQLYTQWCQGCHGNPMNNKDNVLGGKDWNIIKLAMDTKPTMTAELRPSYNAGLITDDTFQTIATYLQTFSGGVTAALQMPSAINFGTVNVNVGSSVVSRTISTTASSNAAVQISTVTSNNPLEFTIVSNTCNGAFVFPGSPCTVGVQFTPATSGARSGKIVVSSNGTGSPQNFDVSGTGQSGSPPPPTGGLTVPSTLSFGSQTVGAQSAAQSISITNGSGASVTVTNVQTSSATEFPIVSNNCGTVAAGGGCTINVAFKPPIAGSRVGTVTVTTNGSGSPHQVTLSGTGTSAPPPPPSANKVPAVEYYNAALGHYFTTAYAAEIAVLDSGQVAGWQRTGEFFYAYDAAVAGTTNPVCRFYLPPAYGNSHFYSAIPTECSAVLVQQPAFVLESSTAFHIASPNPTTGDCPAGTLPVYRLWNQRADTNHRFTTSLAIRNQMVAAGYVAEGYGTGYTMCSPP